MVMMVLSLHPSIYIVSGWSAWQQDDLPGSPASLSCTYDRHTTQVCLCKHLGDKTSEFVISTFFGIMNCTYHLSIKVFRHCTKKIVILRGIFASLLTATDTNKDGKMTWTELHNLTDFHLVTTTWAALLEEAREDQLYALAMASMLDVPLRPDEIFRSTTMPQHPAIEVFWHSTFQGDNGSKQPSPHVHYSSLWWVQVQQDKTTRKQDIAMLTH